MVKEHSLSLMEKSMLGNGGMVKDGTGQNTTKTETSNTRLCMEKVIIINPL
jgi:hypothetical protein